MRLRQLLAPSDERLRSKTVEWPRERIADSDGLELLCAHVSAQLGPRLLAPALQPE